MNKKFLSAILFGALTVASTGSFVSCKDYDDDINNLQTQIGTLANKQDLQSQVSTLQSAISTAQSAAENKAAAAQAAADAAKKAADEAAAKAAAATTEAEKAAADAAAAKAAADAAAAAADLKAAEEKIAALQASLADVEALAATLVKTEDFEAAKKELNDKYTALETRMEGLTGTTGLVGLQIIKPNYIAVGYGKWDGVHQGPNAATWEGPKKDEVAKLANGTYLSQFGADAIEIAVNPTDVDVTNLQLAVVNKYGESAPVAFGTPKAVTRANAAGTYKVDVASAALTSEVVKKFSENFKWGTEGTTAALVAGKVATSFKNGFVYVDQNLNASQSSFYTVVKDDSITGVTTLKAANPELVYDAYILRTGNNDGVIPSHDSLVYKIQYNKPVKGLEFSYDDATIKKAIKESNQQVWLEKEQKWVNCVSIDFMVAQINLNGYIHTGVQTVVFCGKASADPIEKEEVNLDARTHVAKIKAVDPMTGAALQNEVLTYASIKKALGFETVSDESIHFDHSYKSVSIDGAPYYYNDENDKVSVTEWFDTNNDNVLDTKKPLAEVVKINNSDDTKGYRLNFRSDYNKDVFKQGNIDLLDGKTVYFKVKIEATDYSDYQDEPTVTNYYVVVPVTFALPDVKGAYSWTSTEIPVTSNVASGIIDLKSIFESKVYSTTEMSLYVKTKDVKNKNNSVIYAQSSMKAEVQYSDLNEAKENLKKIDETPLANIQGMSVTVNGALKTITSSERAKAKDELKSMYYQLANAGWNEYLSTSGYTAPKASYDWILSSSYTTANVNDLTKIEIKNIYLAKLEENVNVKVSGLMVKALDREVEIDDLTLTCKYTKQAEPTFATEAKLGDNTFLTNSTATAYQPDGNIAGSFTLKDKEGLTLNLSNSTSFTVSKVVWYNGDDEIVEESTATSANTRATENTIKSIVMAKTEYKIAADGKTAYGIHIAKDVEKVIMPSAASAEDILTIKAALAKATKVEVTFTATGLTYSSTSAKADPATATATFELKK